MRSPPSSSGGPQPTARRSAMAAMGMRWGSTPRRPHHLTRQRWPVGTLPAGRTSDDRGMGPWPSACRNKCCNLAGCELPSGKANARPPPVRHVAEAILCQSMSNCCPSCAALPGYPLTPRSHDFMAAEPPSFGCFWPLHQRPSPCHPLLLSIRHLHVSRAYGRYTGGCHGTSNSEDWKTRLEINYRACQSGHCRALWCLGACGGKRAAQPGSVWWGQLAAGRASCRAVRMYRRGEAVCILDVFSSGACSGRAALQFRSR